MIATTVIHVIIWITTHLLTPVGWKAELAQLGNPQRTAYPQNGHLSTTDKAQVRKRLPAKDRRHNHRATPTNNKNAGQEIYSLLLYNLTHWQWQWHWIWQCGALGELGFCWNLGLLRQSGLEVASKAAAIMGPSKLSIQRSEEKNQWQINTMRT